MLIWLQAWLRSKIACVPQILSCLGHTKFSESANPRAEAVRMPEWVPMYRYLVPNARYRCQLTASIEYTQVQKFAWWLVLACRNREHMQCFPQSQHRSCAVPILLRTVPPFSNVPIWGQNGTDFACCTAKTLRDFRSGLSQCKFVHKNRQVLYQYDFHISQDYQRPNFTYRQLKIFLKTQRYFKISLYTWLEQVL